MASRSLRLLSSSNESNLTCLITNCDPFLSPPPPDSIPIDVHHPNRLLPNFLIAAASLLALSFLLLVLFYSLVRLRRRRRRRSSLAANPHPPPPPPHQDPDDDDLLVDDATHHVWFIRTVGLDESLIKAIPAAVYKSGNSDGDHCSVCLGEFRDGESVKLLPKCAHVFHVDCIDTWLRSHVNCPLCRATVVAVAAPASVGDSESTRIEIGDGNQDARFDAADVGNLTAGSSSSSSSSSSSWRIENGNGYGNDLQPIRRSVSMDASSFGVIMLRAESESEEGKLGDGRREVELTAVGVCKDGGGKGDDDGDVGKLGSELKRSMSSRSGRFFFPRYGRGRSASVLPL